MLSVVSSNPTGDNFIFYFLKTSVSILYRNVKFVLITKNPIVEVLLNKITLSICINEDD